MGFYKYVERVLECVLVCSKANFIIINCKYIFFHISN